MSDDVTSQDTAGDLYGVRVAVVGAGPVGLNAASEFRTRGGDVTVFHAGPLTHPHPLGVGAAAAGLVEPVAMAAEDATLVADLCAQSIPVWMTADPRWGVDRRTVRFTPSAGGVPEWVPTMPQAMATRDGRWVFRSAVVTPKIYFPVKVRELRRSGVRITRRAIGQLADLRSEFDIIVNASGPGAWAFGDREMFGSRAVLVWARAAVDEVRFDDEKFLYGIPQRDLVGFGGTAVPVAGDPATWDRRATASEVDRLLSGAHDLYPELRRIDIVAITVNYRPCRPRLRIETEWSGACLLVHLTGFGGSGWTLAPGAARAGANLAMTAMADRRRSARSARSA